MYLLSFIIFDNNTTPYIHEHKFKLDDLDTFNASLVSNVYTLKNEGDSYKWNNEVHATNVATIPNNRNNIIDNTIWVEYDGEGFSNDGFAVDGIKDRFDVSFGSEDYGSENVTDTKSWESNVYEASEDEYKITSSRKVNGTVYFDEISGITK